MYVPCPKFNSTDLQKVSLACEEVLCRSDKRAQFHDASKIAWQIKLFRRNHEME